MEATVMVKTVLDEADKEKILAWINSHDDDDTVKWREFKKFLKFLRDELYSDQPPIL